MAINPETGLNKYGCAPRSRDVLAVGSCTASSPTPRALAVVEEARARLQSALERGELMACAHAMMAEIRARLARALDIEDMEGTEVILTPSGTDAEMLATWLALGDGARPLYNLVMAPAEVGSGTALAAGGRHFDGETPLGLQPTSGAPVSKSLSEKVRVDTIALRDEEGVVREAAVLDGLCRDRVSTAVARGERALLHLVAHTKTGTHAPSLREAEGLSALYPEDVVVLVDAAQGRISRRGLRAALERGWIVLFTGSKFYGGPPFSGALLVPASRGPAEASLESLPPEFRAYFTAGEHPPAWEITRDSLDDDPNLGLLVRWEAALAEIEAYYEAEPARRYQILRAFECMVPRVFEGSTLVQLESVAPPVDDDGKTPLLESKRTVFPFSLRGRAGGEDFGPERLRVIFEWMNRDLSPLELDVPPTLRRDLAARFHLGQPVTTSASHGRGVLRVAIGGPNIVELANDVSLGPDVDTRLAGFESDLRALRRKLEYLAEHFDVVSRRWEARRVGVDA